MSTVPIVVPANDNDPEGPKPGGPKYGMSSHSFSLYLGDCLDQMNNVPDSTVDLILTDLPYGSTACPWDAIIPFDQLWAQYRRVLKPTGTVVSTASQPFTSLLITSNLEWFKYCLVWGKSRATGFLQAKRKPMKIHEDIVVFSPGSAVYDGKSDRPMTYNPQGLVELEHEGGDGKPDLRKPNGNQFRDPKHTKDGTPILKTFGGKAVVGIRKTQTHTNYPTSILTFAGHAKRKGEFTNPTQKPVPLYEYLVRTYSNEGDTVLDNCMGSGTTGVACAVVGNRHFIGIERDPEFFELAKSRIDIASLLRAA